jgi:transposase-like protein
VHHPDTRAELNETAAPARRGFPDVHCLRCGNPDAAVSVDLHDVGSFRCSECQEEWTADDVRAQLRGWEAVLRWVESAPALGQG